MVKPREDWNVGRLEYWEKQEKAEDWNIEEISKRKLVLNSSFQYPIFSSFHVA
jgi:hypothetical protein